MKVVQHAAANVAPVWFQAAMQQIQQSFAELRQDVVNGPIRRDNFNAGVPESPIYPLEVNGQVPDPFPENRRGLFALINGEINPILNFYNLDNAGTLIQKRRRLARFIGLRILDN